MSKLQRATRFTAFASALAFAAVLSAHADIIYNTTGGAENGGDPINATTGAGPILADRFVAPSIATLSSVTLNLSLADGASAGQGFTVDLFSDAGATGPGAVLSQIASVSDSSLTSSFSLYTFDPTSAYLLDGGQSYYIGVMDDGSNAVLGNTLDPAILADPNVANGASYYNSGGVQANAGGPYELSVSVSPVPEPGSFALVLTGGVAALGLMRRRFATTRSV